ncbi:MAG: hypothetical protein AAFQ64_06510 [Pseudomonadota bacterium]
MNRLLDWTYLQAHVAAMDVLKSRPGDLVALHDGVRGVVVINFELSLFATGFEQGGWDDEEGGLLVDGSGEGLVRYPQVVLQNNQKFYEN